LNLSDWQWMLIALFIIALLCGGAFLRTLPGFMLSSRRAPSLCGSFRLSWAAVWSSWWPSWPGELMELSSAGPQAFSGAFTSSRPLLPTRLSNRLSHHPSRLCYAMRGEKAASGRRPVRQHFISYPVFNDGATEAYRQRPSVIRPSLRCESSALSIQDHENP